MGTVWVIVVAGGATRSASVRAGLVAVPAEADVIVVHDGARPLAGGALFATVVAAVRDGATAVLPAVPVVDSLRHRSGGGGGPAAPGWGGEPPGLSPPPPPG